VIPRLQISPPRRLLTSSISSRFRQVCRKLAHYAARCFRWKPTSLGFPSGKRQPKILSGRSTGDRGRDCLLPRTGPASWEHSDAREACDDPSIGSSEKNPPHWVAEMNKQIYCCSAVLRNSLSQKSRSCINHLPLLLHGFPELQLAGALCRLFH